MKVVVQWQRWQFAFSNSQTGFPTVGKVMLFDFAFLSSEGAMPSARLSQPQNGQTKLVLPEATSSIVISSRSGLTPYAACDSRQVASSDALAHLRLRCHIYLVIMF